MTAAKRIKIGVAGCGSISQIMHLPHLFEMRDEFELVALCDASPATLAAMASRYGVRQTFTEYDEFLKADFKAVIIAVGVALHSEMVLKAAAAGKDVLVEKDMCLGMAEADAMVAARDRHGVIIMSGHDRRYDPGLILGATQTKSMGPVKMVRQHWHGGGNFTRHLPIERFKDVPADKIAYGQARRKQLDLEALGPQTTPTEISALGTLTGVGTHHMAELQATFGIPEEIVSAEFPPGWGWWMVNMRLKGGIPCSWTGVHTPNVGEFHESLTAYGDDAIVSIQFPAPYLRHVPTLVTVTRGDCDVTEHRPSYDEAFKEELKHFHHCIITREKPLTDVETGRENLRVMHAVVRCLREKRPVKVD